MRKDLLNILANWFTICGAICLTMYESMLSNPVDFFDLLWRIILLISAGVVGEQNVFSGFDSISSICGKFAASVFPTVVKYVLTLFAVCIVSAGYTVRCNKCICNCSFSVFVFQYFAYCFPCLFPLFLCMSNFSLK